MSQLGPCDCGRWLGRINPPHGRLFRQPEVRTVAYRVYFGKDGDAVVILLGGGTKKRQDRDITTAHDRWADYKKRKTEEQ